MRATRSAVVLPSSVTTRIAMMQPSIVANILPRHLCQGLRSSPPQMSRMSIKSAFHQAKTANHAVAAAAPLATTRRMAAIPGRGMAAAQRSEAAISRV